VSHFLSEGITAQDHPPYSPDLCFLPPKLKNMLKGKRSSDVEDIKSCVKKFLADVPVQDFKN
jgi:hypothetical protein